MNGDAGGAGGCCDGCCCGGIGDISGKTVLFCARTAVPAGISQKANDRRKNFPFFPILFPIVVLAAVKIVFDCSDRRLSDNRNSHFDRKFANGLGIVGDSSFDIGEGLGVKVLAGNVVGDQIDL